MTHPPPIGHNEPPGQIEFSMETVDALSAWMGDHPIIDTEEVAREAKLLLDRGTAGIKDLTHERQTRTAPLLKQVEEIRFEYREPQSILDRVVAELSGRLNAFIAREEDRRRKEADEARRKAEEAERLAREAEEAERKAKEEAQQGVCDVDIAQATRQADEAYSRFKETSREAARSERESTVRIGGGFRRASSLRTKEELVIDDPHEAIRGMGVTDSIRDAILSEARAFRKVIGELPPGVSSIKTRG